MFYFWTQHVSKHWDSYPSWLKSFHRYYALGLMAVPFNEIFAGHFIDEILHNVEKDDPGYQKRLINSVEEVTTTVAEAALEIAEEETAEVVIEVLAEAAEALVDSEAASSLFEGMGECIGEFIGECLSSID